MITSTADLYYERGDELDSLSLQLLDFGGRVAFDGTIRTVRCDRDNALVKQVLASPGAGSVLVVDGGGSLQSALMGDLIAGAAVANDWAGVIIHGAIRDSEAMSALPLGVKACGTNPRKSAKDGVGQIDVPVTVAGVTFAPGKHVWADADGVLVER